MKKKIKDKNQIKKEFGVLSKKVMMAALVTSMVMTPTITASALSYNKNLISSQGTSSVESKVSILKSEGWLESASVEWSAVKGATGYNVYYKSASDSDLEYKQLDNQLIRQYKSYFRADAIGLGEGNYVFKVVPIINGKEVEEQDAITQNLEVKANVREGFAFSSQSPMKTGSGGYNDDGTVPSNAQVIYITADTVNTVTAKVVTNNKGTKTTCKGLADILAKRQKGYDKTPLIIRMVGEIKASDVSGLNEKGYLQLKGCYNLTFEGVGEDATVYGWGILVRNSHNVEIRNLGVMLFPDDAISLDTDNENIWVHNNDIFYGAAGHDADQVKGDGSCDVKQHSTYVTVSYNHFHDSGKCSLCGMSDTENFYVTYHHNWFDHSDSRHPRIRVGTVHVYNNYFDGNSKYGVGATKGCSAYVEANYFRNCKDPMLISLQGTDVYNGSVGGFSREAGGMIKAYNNKIEGASRLVYANENATQFDAYLAKSRDEVVPSSYKTVSGGYTYNNFDTSSTMYSYNPDSPEDVKDKVTTYAGRINGGDLIWNFTNSDDASHTIDTALKDKITNYQSDLVSVGGNSITSTNKDS
ncbi:pectate lyase family protein [Clostridium saccharobutylicum]|uniref:Pectate trisaccharide-lyase Pel n=1 Tax=Clostridium saccharobutylicum DSM 13864 TaxID=1345695 RepID=U5MYJ9_CLOSA|nr:right-handed parallel beta-helix repeat-containing protein [Clostridium saccharobutylicum]AGX44552.1 pectate trisaccharide-lyase Pel [Clostridium saccharobutylicum DSM 13864]AQR91843.1 pectate trisaccharide-lyase precursor [Clostridium saccharobutylicum]AQS01745.1 pectate trisaccharide-lyase precursor [Clostridium saccharobutylicum]AQS11349.1 pectate trisaccharide-lyase precursor [Clostridium saccharobutylicum]AQS15728.1 pectate trisaccharide-lyase precursor [Clostridium saccharobutylicum]